MSEATRRFLKLPDGTMHESAHGDWVRYDAFKTLTQRAEAAEAERDDIIAICRGTQLDDAAIHSMRGYVTEKIRIEAERDALRVEAMLLREFVSSDEIAMTYQTMGQYRAALLKFHTAALAVQP